MKDESVYSLIDSHLNRYFPPDDIYVFDEIVSPDFHLDVFLVKPSPQRAFYTLLTGGVSSLPMNVPHPDFPSRIELMLLLPPDWPLFDDQWKQDESNWPIHMLKTLGRYPHQHHTWFGAGHTIPEPQDSRLYQMGFVATILLKAMSIQEEFQRIPYGDQWIDILMPIPLYDVEYRLKKEKGLENLLDQMLLKGYPDILSTKREKFV